MAIITRDDLINAMINNKMVVPLIRVSSSGLTAGNMASLWRVNGYRSVPSIPTSPATPDNTTGMPIPSVTGDQKIYLANVQLMNSIVGEFYICDRLAHCGGLVGNVATAQTISGGISVAGAAAQGRCEADASDVMWFLEWYTATGSTAVTVTANYTNQDNVSGRTTPSVSLAATRPAAFIVPLFPSTDDAFIKSIQSVTLSATTGTAGNFGVVAVKRLASIPSLIANVGTIVDYASLGLPEINPQSHLFLQFMSSTTSTGNLISDVSFIKG